MADPRRWPGRRTRVLLGLAIGSFTVFVDLLYVTIAAVGLAVALVVPRLRPRITRGADRVAGLERWRLRTFHGVSVPRGGRPLGYLAARVPVGILCGLVLLLLLFGIAATVSMLAAWVFGFPYAFIEDAGSVTLATILAVTPLGVVLLFLNIAGIVGVAGIEARLARSLLGPSSLERYERRISELASSRAAVVEAVDDERRRIERHLHDDVQQRLVALGLLIGRVRRSRSPGQSDELLRQAHEAAQGALDELRDVAWRIYPAALDEAGLSAALETIAERSPLPVHISYSVSGEIPHAVQAAAYFVVSEAVTNAAKHASATQVEVSVTRGDAALSVVVRDDGHGGAHPAGGGHFGLPSGGGLSGLARRVAALDGTLAVDSPPGGPTTITVEVPCD